MEKTKKNEIMKKKENSNKISSKPMVETTISTDSKAILGLVQSICKKRKITKAIYCGNDEIPSAKLWIGILAKEAPEQGVSKNDQTRMFSLMQKGIAHYDKTIQDSGELFYNISWLCHSFANLVRGYVHNPENVTKALDVVEEFKASPGKIRDILGTFESMPYHWREFITLENEGKLVDMIKKLVYKCRDDRASFNATRHDKNPITDFCLYANAIYNCISRESMKGLVEPDPVMVVEVFIAKGGSDGAYKYLDAVADKKEKEAKKG